MPTNDVPRGERIGAFEGSGSWDVPFELVGEVARAGAVAETRDVERLTTARHVVVFQ